MTKSSVTVREPATYCKCAQQGGLHISEEAKSRKEEPSNENLLRGWFEGDAAAFEMFFERQWPRVIGWLLKKGLSSAEADDVGQATFIKLHNRIETYDVTKPALPWLFTIAHSCFLDHLRKCRRIKLREESWKSEQTAVLEAKDAPYQDDVQEPDLQTLTLREQLQSRLESLSEIQQKVVTGRLIYEKSYSSLAQELGRSEASLRKSFERALRLLQQQKERES